MKLTLMIALSALIAAMSLQASAGEDSTDESAPQCSFLSPKSPEATR